MKKVNLFLMNKGGVGKTSLAIYTMLKLLKEEQNDFKIIDADYVTYSLSKRFQDTGYERHIEKLSFNNDKQCGMASLNAFYDKIKELTSQNLFVDMSSEDALFFINEFYCDLKIVNDMMKEDGIDLTLCPVVMVGDRDCKDYLQELIAKNKGNARIAVYANFIHYLGQKDYEKQELKELEDLCKTNSLQLFRFNEVINSELLKSQIYRHLITGLKEPMGLLKGAFSTVVDSVVVNTTAELV